MLRVDELGQEAVCGQCGTCNGKLCEEARLPRVRDYGGIRITNDGNDCALPVAIDSFSRCSFGCAYCFSENSFGHTSTKEKPLGETNLRAVERLFSGEGDNAEFRIFRKALRYDNRNAGGFPAPIQLGAINDPCDATERNRGWLLSFIRLVIKYNQPVRISTKGTVILEKEYLQEIAKAPHLFWFLFSIITPDAEVAAKVERFAPSPQERLRAMKAVTDLGCFAGLRLRPVVPGVSDRTKNFQQAYRVLIDAAAEHGAKSISYEIVYVPMRFNEDQKKRWYAMEEIAGINIREVYQNMGRTTVSLRPSAMWTENIVHAIHERAKQHGFVVGVSEPAWKQLNDDGCCCGMLRTHPVFGNWEPRNTTCAIVNARDTGRAIRFEDTCPDWAYEKIMRGICYMGAGPTSVWKGKYECYSDHLRKAWDNTKSCQNPSAYFQGMLKGEYENSELIFRYVGHERKHPPKVPYWSV